MKTKFCFYSQLNYSHPRTAIEAEILFAAHIMHLRFLELVGGKTPREQNSSGKKIEAESAVLHFVFFIVIVNKMQQSAKSITIRIARNTLPDGNMTRKTSTTNLPGARGNAYPKAELDYDLTYEYDPAYAHRLVHAGNRYYRYDANGNITAEKDGPFTEDDEFVFTYSYDPDTDVYGTDYGFGLDAPKETEETHPENLFAYRRNYTWNEKNLLTKSSDRSYTVHYRYGEDGQRALKYTEEGRSETLYFNNFYTIHIPVQDKNNPQGLRVHKHIFVGNSRLVTAMTHTDNNGDNAEQREKRYYYHSDHLGSAQFVTDWRGKQYEHIEYTPYGELWIEEVAAGLDKLPFRFTGKEMDEETGLYYYGARYLDPKYSRWLSGDPALSDYIPKAPIDDEAKKHNEKLPGMGGVYNTVNLHLYHYAGNNPVKYTDPDGRDIELQNDNLSPKEFKKVEIEFNKVKGSDTEAGKMLREISGDKTKKLTIKFGNGKQDGSYYQKGNNFIYIELSNMDEEDYFETGLFYDIDSTIAHETGHAHADLYGYDPVGVTSFHTKALREQVAGGIENNYRAIMGSGENPKQRERYYVNNSDGSATYFALPQWNKANKSWSLYGRKWTPR